MDSRGGGRQEHEPCDYATVGAVVRIFLMKPYFVPETRGSGEPFRGLYGAPHSLDRE